MEISGLVKTSLIDYPGKIAAVIFTQGCNFQCGFCHNPDLIEIKKGQIKEQTVYQYLSKRVGKLDGVVITGGEPIIQDGLELFIEKVKKMGFKVKLDTNGSNPVRLQLLLDKKMIDYIAMDIKGPLEEYPAISKYLNKKVIQESVRIIKSSGLDYEFRTTVLPSYHELSDFDEIGKMIAGSQRYAIQGFRPEITLDKSLKTRPSFTKEELSSIKEIMQKYVKEVIIRDNI